MKSSPLISIIMPVYNTGDLLLQTIDCIVNQTYPKWELILVDDGSKDIRTIEICNELGAKESRIKVFHKENGGICDARNYGITKASGDYLTFCDHDDEYDRHLLEIIIPYLISANVDILKFSYKTVFPSGKEKYNIMSDNLETIEGNSTNFFRLLKMHYFENIWCCVFKTSLLYFSGIRFDPCYRHGGEDFDFNIRFYKYENRIIIVPNCLYTHYYRQTSTSFSLYDDILCNFVEKQKKINKVADSFRVSDYDNEINYLLYASENLISLLSYGHRMKKTYTDIKPLICSFDELLHSRPSISILLNEKELDRKIGLFLLILLKLKFNFFIYYIYNLYLKLKNEFFS